jgi:hypothetical protein
MHVQRRWTRNGARMGLISMPIARFIRIARVDKVERNAGQRTVVWSQTKHGVQQNRQTGVNHINQQAFIPGTACRTYP